MSSGQKDQYYADLKARLEMDKLLWLEYEAELLRVKAERDQCKLDLAQERRKLREAREEAREEIRRLRMEVKETNQLEKDRASLESRVLELHADSVELCELKKAMHIIGQYLPRLDECEDPDDGPW